MGEAEAEGWKGRATLGAPLRIPGLVSPLTSVRAFQTSTTALVKSLQEELKDLPYDMDGIDILVEDLKAVTDDDIFESALKEFEVLRSCEASANAGDSNQSDQLIVPDKETCNAGKTKEDNRENEGSHETSNGNAFVTLDKAKEDIRENEGSHVASDKNAIATSDKKKEGNGGNEESHVASNENAVATLDKTKEGNGGNEGSHVASNENAIATSDKTKGGNGGNEGSHVASNENAIATSDKIKEGNGGNEGSHVASNENAVATLDKTKEGNQENEGSHPASNGNVSTTSDKKTLEERNASKKSVKKHLPPIRTPRARDLGSKTLEERNASKKSVKKHSAPIRTPRARDLGSKGISILEEHIAELKAQRENARKSGSLHSLRVKHAHCSAKERGVGAAPESSDSSSLKHFISSLMKTDNSALDKYESIRSCEVLLCIEFFHNKRKHRKWQEFLVLGSQFLTELRDKLYCLTDELMKKANLYTPSGYFFIEDVFYNDMRDPRASDYSAPIIKWMNNSDDAIEKWKAVGGASRHKRRHVGLPDTFSPFNELPDLRVASMASTRFANLHCHLGKPYLYCHQGDCKHWLVIRDLRLVHKEDVQNLFSYPLSMYQPRLRHRKCSICDIYRAKKVTYADKLASENPCYFCEYCYFLLHYSKDGELLYNNFTVHNYFHE